MNSDQNIWGILLNGKIKYLFLKEKDAMNLLDQHKKETRYRLGVTVLTDTDTEYITLLGWEEHRSHWKIVSLPIGKMIFRS